MRLALQLAGKAEGWTSPNPMVGAVIVKDGRIIGQGYHQRAGAAHAEVVALRQAGAQARGATLYVTLEPCNHTGRTPPCCGAILAAGVSRVIVAARDPNRITNGRGIARLRRAGVHVLVGALEREARALNEPFEKAVKTGLPLVIAKVGQSLDGKIATVSGESRWITSSASRRIAHDWRRRVDAILVGVNTVLQDDPALTVRGLAHRPDRPIRVIVDSRLRAPASAACFSGGSRASALIATTVQEEARHRAWTRRGVEVLALPARQGRVPLGPLCRALVRRGVHSVLIEGGSELLAGAFAERLVDRIVFFIAPVLIGGRDAPSALGGEGIRSLRRAIRLEGVVSRRVGEDLCVEAHVVYPTFASRK